MGVQVFSGRASRWQNVDHKFKGRREAARKELMLHPAPGRQNLSISNLHQGMIIFGRRFILENQLTQGNIEGVRNALHAAEGRINPSRFDLAQKADGPSGHFGHSAQGEPFLFPQIPESFSQSFRINFHRSARIKIFIIFKIFFSICQ
jgi:hypothetical protein